MRRSVPLKQNPDRPLERTPMKRSKGFTAASKEQRAKIKDQECAYYRADLGCIGAIQPAHVVARSKGGCDDALCVIPLCAFHHRRYDDGELDLLRMVSRTWPDYRAECQHALEHLSPVEMVEQLANARVEWRAGRVV